MTRYDPGQPLISLHVPKTAGNSLRAALQTWFGGNLFLHYRGDQGQPPARVEIRPGICIHGHFNRCRDLGALQYYPAASQFIVFLRNPFDRFVSQWRYLHFQTRAGVPVPELAQHPTFADWLEHRRHVASTGQDPYSFLAQLPHQIDADAARPFGPNFLCVGIAERFAESLDLLARVLGFPPIAPARLNAATESFRAGDPSDDFHRFRRQHELAFPLEYAVYESGQRWLQAALEVAPAQ